MSERQMRKMISYKIENLSPKERAIVDDWANSQFNIQQSLTNIILHVVGFIGNTDVMDFDVQKKLHVTLGNTNTTEQVKPTKNSEPYERVKPRQRNEINEFPEVDDLFNDD